VYGVALVGLLDLVHAGQFVSSIPAADSLCRSGVASFWYRPHELTTPWEGRSCLILFEVESQRRRGGVRVGKGE
jgi:hypothetical protein